MRDETQINPEEEPEEEPKEKLIFLRKLSDPERRSGHERRELSDSARQLRLEVERESREKIHYLFEVIADRDLVIVQLKNDIAELRRWQAAKEPVLSAADQVVSAGAAFTWVIKLIVGVTMLIGGVAGTYEIIKRWTH